MTILFVGISVSTKNPEIIQIDAKNKKIPADCMLEIERIDFKIELKNFMIIIWRRMGLYQLSYVIDAFYIMTLIMSIIRANAFLLIFQGDEFALF